MENFDKILGKSYDELLPIYRKLAKRADQRLLRLEEYGKKRKSVLDWAYKKAAYEAQLYGGKKEKPRFNIKPPETEKQLRRKIAAMQNFLYDMPTSTVSGIKEIDKKRLKTLNETFKKLDPDFSNIPLDKWMELHESGAFARLDDKHGFYTTMEAIGTIEKDKDKIRKLIQEAEDENVTLKEKIKEDGSYDIALREAINDVLTMEGVDINTLL